MSGVRPLVWAFLRRDRWSMLWWGLGAMVLYYAQAVSVEGLYATQEEFDAAAAAMEGNAAFIAMAGPARALNTIGGQVTWQASAFGAIVAGLMSMFLLTRHTRAEEDSGRDELLRAAAVDRTAPTTAGVITVLLANVWLGLLVAVSLASFPLAAADSIALGVGLTLCGWFFTAVALLAAQVTSSARATYAVTGTVIGVAYMLRAVGDVSIPALAWLSPIGWYQAMHPFSGLRWWPALLLVGAGAAVLAAGYAVFGRRDFGAGVVASRPGPARAGSALLRGRPESLGLAWRLQRGSVLGWGLGLLFTGLSYGSMGGDVGDILGDSALTRDVLAPGGADLTSGFYASAMLILGLISTGFAISSASFLQAEEGDGRVEALLATGTSRTQWWLGHVVVTVVGTMVVVGAGGFGLALSYSAVGGEPGSFLTYLAGSLQYAAPVLVLAAVAWVLHGWWPRASALAWLGLGFCVAAMIFGPLLRWPQWLVDLSPFSHLALVPVVDLAATPLLVVAGVAVVLAVVAHRGFVRRDLR